MESADLYESLEALHERCMIGETVSREEIARKREECRERLRGPNGGLGLWEEELLAYPAEHWVRIALVAMAKAVEVNQLSAEDYDEGFNYTSKGGNRQSVS